MRAYQLIPSKEESVIARDFKYGQILDVHTSGRIDLILPRLMNQGMGQRWLMFSADV